MKAYSFASGLALIVGNRVPECRKIVEDRKSKLERIVPDEALTRAVMHVLVEFLPTAELHQYVPFGQVLTVKEVARIFRRVADYVSSYPSPTIARADRDALRRETFQKIFNAFIAYLTVDPEEHPWSADADGQSLDDASVEELDGGDLMFNAMASMKFLGVMYNARNLQAMGVTLASLPSEAERTRAFRWIMQALVSHPGIPSPAKFDEMLAAIRTPGNLN